ncbi:hypothetical protein BO79DRAFT_36502 [Aspergillus costaricaensis CBS 115574]|uniref:Uncharacterized protein n=1 Tax=Aspergillus costaricaensis CBS 115574 TaxID=1448317 RepID=A0ACD1I7C3_9EURO|nr:hypothetical protein BO79DRAFT_36502 [Aspergillus costaricaensis CBS 115574]RAK86471.1 hypothetical protein BO79DRAFT_36502 [Aspergillus costaricaensis CBS 115574]
MMNDSFPCLLVEASTFTVEDRLQNVCSIIQLFIVFCHFCLAFSFLVAQRKPHSALLAFSMAKRHTFFQVRSVEDQNQTVFSRAASTPPWCSLLSDGRTIFTTDILSLSLPFLFVAVHMWCAVRRSGRPE